MRLRFALSKIEHWSGRYPVPESEMAIIGMHDAVRHDRCLTLAQLRQVVHWKSPRNTRRVTGNSESFVKEVTEFALGTADERARISALTLLDGVLWPTASVVLHLFHQDPYPILDFRAIWSVGAEVPRQYAFAFWWAYTDFCRRVAAEGRIPMRTLDRALWQYSKERQKQ